jgi:Transglycosylase SLT domain
MPATRSSALAVPHGFKESVRWRTTPKGVEIAGKIERTPGPPNTVTHVWESFHAGINEAASKYGVPAQLIIATICTESSGNPKALRLEPRWVSDLATPHQVSPGLMQTLISTARGALGNQKIDRAWLFNPRNSIMAGTAYIKSQAGSTNLDPPLVAAAYNAGSLRHNGSPQNRWRLLQYPIGTSAHCDRFVKFFNDACAALATHPIRPTVGLEAIVGPIALPPVARKVAAAKKAAKVVAAKKPAAAKPAPAVPAAVRIVFGDNARADAMTPFSRQVLSDIMRKAGIDFALVSSTQRTPGEQAHAMFVNLESLGVRSQKDLYGPNGDLVIDVYAAGKARGKTAAQILKEMERRIVGLGPSNVSHHAADPKVLNVFDVAPSSIPAARQAAFERAVRADKRVRKFFTPNQGDPGFHLEIPQPVR